MKLRTEFYWDDEARNWGFNIPALHIVGGGDETREAAVSHAIDAIEFALEGVERDFSDETEVEFLDVDVRPPKVVATRKAG